MSSTQTVTFICGVIMCLIGVSTFITSMLSKAKSDGILSNKVDTALKGIDEIKSSLNDQRKWREEIAIITARQDEQIDTLFKKVKCLEQIVGRGEG